MASWILSALVATSSTAHSSSPTISSQSAAPSAIAASYGLSSSTMLAMPTASLSASSAAAYIQSAWRVQGNINGVTNIAFVADPFAYTTAVQPSTSSSAKSTSSAKSSSTSAKPSTSSVKSSSTSPAKSSSTTPSVSATKSFTSSTRRPSTVRRLASTVKSSTSSTAPAKSITKSTSSTTSSPAAKATPVSNQVLRVTYPAGSYAHPNTAGAQFYVPFPASSKPLQSMLLSYEVAFDPAFEWVQGGKLPGLRGGSNTTGCSGGVQSDGVSCFSTRLMWRAEGAGEVYAYTLTPPGQCSNTAFMCHNNGDGTSIDRGSFYFESGGWQNVTLLVRLNQPVSSANGLVSVYFDDQMVLQETNIQYRNSSLLGAGGLFFSTFYGGSTSAYAPTSTEHAYFRNFRMWASS